MVFEVSILYFRFGEIWHLILDSVFQDNFQFNIHKPFNMKSIDLYITFNLLHT